MNPSGAPRHIMRLNGSQSIRHLLINPNTAGRHLERRSNLIGSISEEASWFRSTDRAPRASFVSRSSKYFCS